jgi:nucleoid DNA-binding protein
MMSETKKPLSKTDVINALAESTGLTRKDVGSVISSLTELIGKEIGKKGPQVFNIPGLLKITVITKPATKATQRANPFKPGEMMTVKAKPARKVVKIRALKALKDMA